MRNLLIIPVFAWAISCTYDDISTKSYPPHQISQPLLVGSWKMETNRGVDVSFDIVEYDGKSWAKHTILGFNGKTTVLAPDDSSASVSITEPILKSPTGSIQMLMWANKSYYSDAENEVSFYSLQPNTSYSQLTGKLGYAVVFGLDSNTSIPPLLDTINFNSPIIINKVK